MRFVRIITTFIVMAFAVTAFTVSAYAAPPVVDSFAGVLWWASREQVQVAMAEKGYTLLEQRSEPQSYEKYRGTFAGHPAELRFWYKKNRFLNGMFE